VLDVLPVIALPLRPFVFFLARFFRCSKISTCSYCHRTPGSFPTCSASKSKSSTLPHTELFPGLAHEAPPYSAPPSSVALSAGFSPVPLIRSTASSGPWQPVSFARSRFFLVLLPPACFYPHVFRHEFLIACDLFLLPSAITRRPPVGGLPQVLSFFPRSGWC